MNKGEFSLAHIRHCTSECGGFALKEKNKQKATKEMTDKATWTKKEKQHIIEPDHPLFSSQRCP